MKRDDAEDADANDIADDYEPASSAGRELGLQVRRYPYLALAAGAGLGLALGGGANAARWIAPAAALALRAGTRWAVREGLRHLVTGPSRTAFNRAGPAASSPDPSRAEHGDGAGQPSS